ncbi:IQ motif and SEC7 domain-containing protein 1-like isoform X4 [Haliotis rufescens]|uniref:IQ motif and SEC7 domain-containing protein 1-like isoform X4 n=1 Tax=Haliotis rufescens TaxID=6454 RepID=UPI00201EB4C5|nr:IQ motif and SEC7 domain-containing protein 1-like isoform X4 [Haliotis rufescens]
MSGVVFASEDCCGLLLLKIASFKKRVGGSKVGDRKQSVGSPLESPRSSKLVNQGSISCSRIQRQRSFKSSNDDVIKRSRTQSVSYELSQDLHDKQVEMLERKYGGSIRSRRAAKTIQRAFRQYCMTKNFQKLRHSVGERRLSKRLSELGRSNTIWTDRFITDGKFEASDVISESSFGSDVRKMVAEFESGRDHKLYHQMSFDHGVKVDSQKARFGRRGKKLERSVEIDITDIPCEKEKKGKPGAALIEETNNNRNSYPEMNDSSASDSPQPTPLESAVDPHSLDFETLLESKETDILTDSFHSDSIHSESSQEASTLTLSHRPSASSLGSDFSVNTTADSARGSSASFDSFRNLNSESCENVSVASDVQIKVDLASPEDTRLIEQNQTSSPNDGVKYYMNSQVKLRSRKPGEEKVKPAPPVRAPDTSPIWKRKGNGGTVNGNIAPVNAVKAEAKRMSNISETSEPDSIDGQCSSSPSSENISTENISISSENSISYQRRLRLSVTPDQQTMPRTNDKQRKRAYRIGLNLFNKKPDKGLNFLLDHGFLEGSPRSVAKFFILRKGLSKQMIGEYLGNLQQQFNMEVLHYFTEEIDLSGLQVDVALRKYQSYFRMPGEAQKIERLMEAFADRYCVCNPDQIKNFKNTDTIFLLAFAIIMLNTDLHNSNIKHDRKMKLEDFIKNLRGIDDGGDVDRDLLAGIYVRVREQEFRSGVDHVSQVAKVEQTIVGKKPALTLAWRRLVCYCRLYEVHDPNKKEKIGLHQREVFLFNDMILVTKIFSKKKSGITYALKNSASLCGMQVFLFETSHYQFGIQLNNTLDGKVILTFNARNDHDRQKFVEDLKEAIMETNGMEQMRIEEELHRHRTNHNTLEKHYANDDSRVLMYDHMKPSDPAINRLSAPECGGLKKHTLSNSLTDLCEAPGMKRGSSGASLDSGVVSGSVGSASSREDAPLSPAASHLHNLSSGSQGGITKAPGRRNKLSQVQLKAGLPEGTEV